MTHTTPTYIFTASKPQPGMLAIKAKMKATWMDGDYARFARYMEPGARKQYPQWVYPFSVAELVEYFRLYFGPVRSAFAVLDEVGQQSLRDALESNFATHNLATDDTVHISGEYLEVTAIRR